MIHVENLKPNRETTVGDLSDTQKLVKFRTTSPFVSQELLESFMLSEIDAVEEQFEGYELIADERNKANIVPGISMLPVLEIEMVIQKIENNKVNI